MQERYIAREVTFAEIKEEQWITVKEIRALRHAVCIRVFGEHIEGKAL
jgi:hypothetical protein